MLTNFKDNFDQNKHSPVKKILYVFITALLFIGLITTSSYYILEKQSGDAHIINIAGRQRMLSQQITKVVLLMEIAENETAFTEQKIVLEQLFSEFSKLHNRLQFGDTSLQIPENYNSNKVDEMFVLLEPHFVGLKKGVTNVAKITFQTPKEKFVPALAEILKNEPEFLRIINQIVFQYEQEANQKIKQFENIQLVLLLIALLVLVLEFLLIFRPMANKLKIYLNSIQQSKIDLSETSQKLKDAQQASQIGNWQLDLNTNEVVWSAELYQMYGLDPTLPPPLYPEHKNQFTLESWEVLTSSIARTKEQGIPYELELKTIRKDESNGWMWVRGEAVFDVNKNIIGLKGVAQDITEKKILELEKEALMKRLNYALDASGDGIWDATLIDGKTVYSKASLEMLGYEVGELTSLTSEWSDRLHPDDAEWVFAAINKVTQTPENGDTVSHEYRFRNKAGDYLWMLNKAKVVERNEKGEASRVIGTHTNITERKKAEVELTKTKDFLLQTSKVAQIGGWDFDNLTGKISWSDVICDIHEVPHGFVPTYEQMANFYIPESWVELEKAIHKSLVDGTPYDLEAKIMTDKGKLCWVRAIGNSEFKDGKCVRLFGVLQDINDRKKTELVLQESERKFRELFEHLIDEVHLWKVSKDKTEKITGWQLVDANPAALKSWGKSINEVIGKTANEIFGADANTQFMPTVEEIFKTGKSHKWEQHFPTTDQYLQMESIPFGDYFISTGKDITATKKENQHLKLFESVITNTKDAVLITEAEPFDEPGPKIIYVNEAFTKMTGYTAEEVIGKTPRILQGPNSDREELAKLSKAIRKWESCEITTINYKKSGEEFWINFSVTPVVDETGWYTHWIAIERDVTEQKKYEQVLKESELRFSVAIEGTEAGIWDWDLLTNKAVFSKQSKAMLGYEDAEIENSFEGWKKLWHPDDSSFIEKAVTDHLNGISKKYEVIHRCLHKDGGWRWIMTRGKILRDLEDKPYRWVGTTVDITAQKQAEENQKIAKEQAEAANKAKSEFLANMSHEIRTPLNGVIGFTELLTQTPLSPVQQQYASSANVSGHTLLSIINDILDFSKIEAGMLELELLQTDMVVLLENSIDIVIFSAADKEFELLLDIDPAMPRFAQVDAIRTQQILANLLSNAIKFTKKGEVALKVVYQALDGKQGRLSFSVRDTGIGISEEQKAKLFKSFSQADSSTTRKFGGTGLGLVISQMIAEKMGSKIKIDSIPDLGTTFSFEIITHFEEGEKLDTTQIIGVKRCLIIDDNDNNLLILEQMLKQWQIEVDSCNNGFEAIKKLENSQTYDVIICDYDMPYLNGIDTIILMKDKLKLSTEKQPVILLHSSVDSAELNQKSKELGIRFRLNKPVKSKDLFNYLSNLNQTAETSTQKEIEQTVNLSHTSEKIKILIAEDNPLNMMLSKTMLLQLMPNSEVYEAKNGLEAIEQYESISLDLIFMDLHMPELDGIEVTKKIRALEVNKTNHLPIVALTAGALKEEKAKCLAAGMDDFLTKPLEYSKIQTVLTKFFQYRKKTDADLENTEAKNEIHFGFSELKRSMGNDIDVTQKLVRMFITNIPTKIDELEQACKEIDSSNIKAIAHSIVGTSLSMRCTVLADIGRKMDKAADENNSFENFEVLLAELKEEWEIVKKLLHQKIDH